ncbi:MAG: OmpA family protein [Proteobacteria bacterium]|nr:OmpA family protein [Pseudomonadota bacterium]
MRASFAVAGLLAVGLAQPALAQTPPSPDSIVKALTPGGGMGATTRGIRVVHGKAVGPSVNKAVAPSVNLNIDFATGSAQLTPEAVATLDSLGRALTDPTLAHDRFRIEGHTDTVGSAATNQALSEQRAQRVAEYLEDKFSIPSARLKPVGMGEQDLLVPTPPQTPEARNRRVRVVNEGG